MESDRDPRAMLAAAERAEVAPHLDYRPTPRWYAPAVGAWSAAVVLTIGGLREYGAAVFLPVVVVLLVAEVVFMRWYRRYLGTMPSIRHAPPEIAAAYRRFYVGAILVAAATVAVFVLAGPIVAAAVALVTVTAGLVLYERHYAAAAATTRRRLG